MLLFFFEKIAALIKKYFNYREPVIHVLFWLLYFSMINADWSSNWFDASLRPSQPAPLSYLAFPLFFYLNAFWLIPHFLRGKKGYRYFLIAPVVLLVLPELIRVGLTVFLSPEKPGWAAALWNRDSLVLSNPSPLWLALLFSFGYRFTKDWVVNTRRIERLESEKIHNELRLLKAQVNPHFLFNNLNTLDDLIDRNPNQAKIYLHQLSRIYRYILQRTEEDVVLLNEEWNFMIDYVSLLEERFGGAYRFERSVDGVDLEAYLIPPTALQGLIENVVKHNEGSIQNPLVTEISVSESGIRIRHPKRPKTSPSATLGTGLKNLEARFQLSSGQSIQVEEDSHFTVTLPLIKQVG